MLRCLQALNIVCAVLWISGTFSATPGTNDRDFVMEKEVKTPFFSVRSPLSSGCSPVSQLFASSNSKGDGDYFSGDLQALEIAPKVNLNLHNSYQELITLTKNESLARCQHLEREPAQGIHYKP